MLRQLGRIMQAGSRNFGRNLWLSTAATVVMTVTLTVVAISFISNWALTSTIKGVTDKIDVSIYLKADITDAQVASFRTSLETDPNTASVVFVSVDQAVANYREQNKNNPQLLQALDVAGAALPPSLEVKTNNPNKLNGIIAIVNQPDNAKLLDPTAPPSYSGNRKTTIDRIVNFSNFFKSAGLLASLLFIVISILIIFNTIRMAIFTRRDEIEIMKLVGATKWFIRGPFIFEAALYGIIGGVVAVVLAYSLLLGGGPKLGSYIDINATINFFRSYPVLVVGGEILIGIAIGAFSSLLALSRYLKL